jgi:sialic acid synthase SpsE
MEETMSWRVKIPGSFGSVDAIFAEHPADLERAKEAIKEAKDSGATQDDFAKELVWHVYKKVKHAGLKDHLDETIRKLEKLW